MAAKHFMLLFMLCFALTVVAFGMAYHALAQLGYSVAATDSGLPTLWQATYFSLLVITTSAELRATAAPVQGLLAAEILYGIGLLSLLILQFSTVSLEEVTTRRTQLVAELEEAIRTVAAEGAEGASATERSAAEGPHA